MSIAQERIAKGQCPNCGKEAAPYYLCGNCADRQKVYRVLREGERAGGFKGERRGKLKYWSIRDTKILDDLVARSRSPAKLGDKRLQPRLRGFRVDVEATLLEVIRHVGRPMHTEEIIEAWGKLRDRRTSPLAHDLARIVAAEDKRKRKAARQAGMLA